MSKTLTVYLAADTARFRRDMNQAENAITGFGSKAGGLGPMIGGLGTLMAGAAIAAGAFAVKLGVDAVNAAMQEQQELAKLNTTLQNMGFGSAEQQVKSFIDELQYSANIPDTELRPAFERLVRSADDVTHAQTLMSLALDISAGTGKNLKTVTDALGRAMDGNTTSLGKLGTGLDKASLKTGDMDSITSQLAKRFQGQAATAAATMKSRLEGVKIAADELAESFGTGLVEGLQDAAGGSDDLEQMFRDLGTTAEIVGKFVGGALVAYFNYMTASIRVMGNAISMLDKGFILLSYGLGRISESEKNARLAAADANIAFNNQEITARGMAAGHALASMFVDKSTDAFNRNEHEARRSATALDDNSDSAKENARNQSTSAKATDDSTDAFERQKEKLNGTTTALEEAVGKVNQYAKQITDFRTALTGQIMSGVDLGAAFEQQGTEGGVSLIDAFLAQLANAENFADVLQRMDQGGASQALIDMVASKGPEIGTKLGQQLLDEGLIPTINDKFEATRTKIYATTSTLIPDFLLLGQQSALATMEGLEEKIEKNEKRLRKMGQDIGEPIGAEIKAKIAAAVDAAIKAAQAAAAAAPISIGGQTSPGAGQLATTTAPAATARATTVLLNNVLTQSNYRGGNVTGGTLVFS